MSPRDRLRNVAAIGAASDLAGPMLEPGEGATASSARAARGLCRALAWHAGELARLADGGTVTGDSIAAASSIAAGALEVLTAAPLRPWWQGWAANLAGAVDGLCDLTGAAWQGSAAAGIAPATADRGPLDAARAARDIAAALAVGILEASAEGIAAGPLDTDAPAVRALLSALLDRANSSAGDDAALDLHRYLSEGEDA